tara:strand:+ start:53819 stop:53947 length:129 start_codon:yes stop_codon:yes gene_type:complete
VGFVIPPRYCYQFAIGFLLPPPILLLEEEELGSAPDGIKSKK